MKPWAVKLIRYGAALGVGLVFLFVYFIILGLFSSPYTAISNKILSDGFVLVGFLLIGAAALVFVANQGFFNFLNYTLQHIVSRFTHNPRTSTMSYGDFVESRTGKKRTPCLFLFLVGLLFLAVGIVFTVLYMNNPVNYETSSSISSLIS